MNLKEFLQTFDDYNQRSILESITFDSWNVWNSDQSVEEMMKKGGQYPYLLRAYGHKLAALTILGATENGKWKVTNTDVGIFLNRFLGVYDIFTGVNNEGAKIVAALKSDASFEKFSLLESYLTDSLGEQLRIHSFMARQLNSQWQMCSLKGIGVERNFLVYEKFLDLINHDDRAKIEGYFNNTPIGFLRSVYGLLTLSFQNYRDLRPGVVGFREQERKSFSLTQLDLNYDDILHCAHRLSWTSESLKEHLGNNIRFDDVNAKHFASPFTLKPFLDWQVSGWERAFICPSPWMILIKLSSVFTDFYSDLFDREKTGELLSKWGEASEEVFIKVVQEIAFQCEIIEIDEKEKERKSRFADLILYDSGRVMILEFKNSLGSIADKNELGPESVSKLFYRQLSALEQCHETNRNIKKYIGDNEVETVAYVVVSGQYQVYDSALTATLDSDSSYFIDQNYPGFEVMDMDKLENILAKYSVKEAVGKINERTKFRRKRDFDTINSNFYEVSSEHNIELYNEAKERILPSEVEKEVRGDQQDNEG